MCEMTSCVFQFNDPRSTCTQVVSQNAANLAEKKIQAALPQIARKVSSTLSAQLLAQPPDAVRDGAGLQGS